MTLGEKIEFHRKRLGLTKVKLAAQLGLQTSSTITQWAKNNWPPSPENLVKLAGAFGVPVTELMAGAASGPAEAIAQKHHALYKRASALSDGVRDATPSYPQDRDFTLPPGAKFIVKKEPVQDNLFDLPLYSNQGYLPFLIESFDDGQIFALEAGSDRIYNDVKTGDHVIIKLSNKAINNTTMLVKIKNKHAIRLVEINKNSVTLRDGKRQLKVDRKDFEPVGRVIAFLRLP